MTDAAPPAAPGLITSGSTAGAVPVTAAELRAALNGAPGATDEHLAQMIAVALGHIVPNLDRKWRPDDDGNYPDWPADLHDGAVLAAMLTVRNREAPSAATTEGGYASAAVYGVPMPSVPPIAWDPRIRHRLLRFMDTAGMVG